MKNHYALTIRYLTFAILVILLIAMTIQVTSATSESYTRKIIVFKSRGVTEPTAENILKKHGAVKLKNLRIINAVLADVPLKALRKLTLESEVLRIDDDVEVRISKKPGNSGKPAPSQPPQVLPWGIDRIDAELAKDITTGKYVKVGVIDTGIDVSHPDLKSNIKGGYNAINPNKSYTDDNGHGSHVAGIIAAIDNSIGVVGTGAEISLYSVKVLNRNGSGFLSDVIEGIEWSINNSMQVINMSLGTSSDIESFHDAVKAAYRNGIVVVAAAGNEGSAVSYPAAYDEAIAVSATDSSDQRPWWSNFGTEVDFASPGVSIYSTYKGSTYATLSGTSMATPHVAGTAALTISHPINAEYDLNSDGKWNPEEVKNRLIDASEDLGDTGFDIYYGFGLPNAYQAVQLSY